jgi:Tol biopolymer transport system component/DNA-binding winged helix-turn-helix (wHTH) protein
MNRAIGHKGKHLYEFGPFRLDPAERVLVQNGERVSLAPKAFDTLLIFVQHSGRALTKDDLIKSLWPDTSVEENNLTQQISQLRHVLGEGTDGLIYIETLPKRGYRFIPEVREIVEGDGELVLSRRARTRIVLREEIEEEEGKGDLEGAALQEHEVASWVEERRSSELANLSRWVLPATAVILMTGVVVLGWRLLRVQAQHPGIAVGSLQRLTSDAGLTMSPALSRDGRFIAYASDRRGQGNLDIWIQPVSGGGALRLTGDSTDDYAPDFSPDGQTIIYRSERAGGGIYAISVHGGEPRLLAAYGRRPKFSPDGKWIAYWVGEETEDNIGNFMVPGQGRVFIIASNGGSPIPIQPHFAAAGYPIWAPDGRHLLFLGNRDPNLYHEGSIDWWVAPIDNGEVVRTGTSAALQKMHFASSSQAPASWTEDGTAVLMSATLDYTRNIWTVPISTKSWKVVGPPKRLTLGTATDSEPTVAGDKVAYTSLTTMLEIWSLPIDANQARPSGAIQRLTGDADAHGYPAVSPDGTIIAFTLQHGDDRKIWIKDLTTGRSAQVSRPGYPAFNPNFSPDGKELIYRSYEDRSAIAYLVSLSSDDIQPICRDCSDYGWSSDKRWLALVGTSPAGISILELATRQRSALLQHPEYRLWNARFSPDDHSISFNVTEHGHSRIFIAPIEGSNPIRLEDWIAIPGKGWDDKPRWSPDGNTLYFVSDRDGFRCIWAQRLDRRKHPIGDPISILHFHESGRSMSRVGPGDLSISVARDKIVFNVSERQGNLWLTSLDAQH